MLHYHLDLTPFYLSLTHIDLKIRTWGSCCIKVKIKMVWTTDSPEMDILHVQGLSSLAYHLRFRSVKGSDFTPMKGFIVVYSY